jgi:hypothetical protein
MSTASAAWHSVVAARWAKVACCSSNPLPELAQVTLQICRQLPGEAVVVAAMTAVACWQRASSRNKELETDVTAESPRETRVIFGFAEEFSENRATSIAPHSRPKAITPSDKQASAVTLFGISHVTSGMRACNSVHALECLTLPTDLKKVVAWPDSVMVVCSDSRGQARNATTRLWPSFVRTSSTIRKSYM